MKNLYLILAICLISTFTFGQKNHYQNNLNDNNSIQLNNLNKLEIFELNENAIHNDIISQKKKSYSKTNENKQGVSEYINTAKNWNTGTVENSSKVVFNYNSQGQLYLKTYYSWDNNRWNYSLKFEYVYASGKLSMLTDYWYENNSWQKNTKTTYSYNAEGNVVIAVKQYQHNSVWTNYTKIDYTYNQYHRLDYFIDYNWTAVVSNWTQINKTLYGYGSSKKNTNSNHNIYFITVYKSDNGWVNYRRTAYTYDDYDNVISEASEGWTAPPSSVGKTLDWNTFSKLDYTYDVSNRLVEYITWYSDGTNLMEYYKNNYTYDEYDNVDLQMVYKRQGGVWKNNNRVINLVYDNSFSSDDLILHNIFDEKIEIKHMLKSMANEEWTSSSTWQSTGGMNIDYVEVHTLNINREKLFSTKVYPNPSNGFISIEFDKTMSNPRFEIFESNGKRILHKEISNGEKINTSNFKSGLYFYRLSDGYKTSNGKILIK